MSHNVYVIYRILNTISGKSYVGLTHNPRRRRKDHFRRLRVGIHHSLKLQNSFNKHGKAAFQWEILEEGVPVELCVDREKHWIVVFNSYREGYNMADGGQGVRGVICSWNGIEYPSISDAADANGISCGAMSQRLKKGYTCDEDVPKRHRSFVWNNIEYPTVKAAADACGVSVSAMRARFNKGYRADTDMFSEFASFYKPRSKKIQQTVLETPNEVASGRKPINLLALTQELKRPA